MIGQPGETVIAIVQGGGKVMLGRHSVVHGGDHDAELLGHPAAFGIFGDGAPRDVTASVDPEQRR